MRICIPTETNEGMNAPVSRHFGSAPFFSLVDTETGDIDVLGNAGRAHGHGQCHPARQLNSLNLDAVACGGMGRNAHASLVASGIEVYISMGRTVEEVLDEARGGFLRPLPAEHACRGHGHRHGVHD